MPLPLNPFLAAILGQAQVPPAVDPTRPRVTSMKPRAKGGVADYSATLGPAWSTENRGEHPAQAIVDRSGGGERIAMGPTEGTFAPSTGGVDEPWQGYAASPIQTTVYRAEPRTREFVFRSPRQAIPNVGVPTGNAAQVQDQLDFMGARLRAMTEAGATMENSPQLVSLSAGYQAAQKALDDQNATRAQQTQADALAQQAATGERTADEDLAVKRLTAQAQLADAEARGRQAAAAEAESRMRTDPATLFRGNPEAIPADPRGAFRALGPGVPNDLILGGAGIKPEDTYEAALQRLIAGGYGNLPEAVTGTPYADWTDPNILRHAMGIRFGPQIAAQLGGEGMRHLPWNVAGAERTREDTRRLFGGVPPAMAGAKPQGLLPVSPGAPPQDTPLATGQSEPRGLAPAPVAKLGVRDNKRLPRVRPGIIPGAIGTMFRPW